MSVFEFVMLNVNVVLELIEKSEVLVQCQTDLCSGVSSTVPHRHRQD